MKKFNWTVIMLSILFMAVFQLGCLEDEEAYEDSAAPAVVVDDSMIVSALVSGSVVQIDDQDSGMVAIDGHLVGRRPLSDFGGPAIAESKSAITTGCFGYPQCVSLTENFRALVSLATDDFAFYCGSCTGTTYFFDTYYNPYWYSGIFPAIRGLIIGAGYQAKIIDFCLSLPPGTCGDFDI